MALSKKSQSGANNDAGEGVLRHAVVCQLFRNITAGVTDTPIRGEKFHRRFRNATALLTTL